MGWQTDIVVVGAGAAGIAAGMRLKAAGAPFIVVEAQDRIGGRAWTDAASFPGVAFDRGCHWLHEASRNPYRAIADDLGFAYDRSFRFDTRNHVIGGQRADSRQCDAIDAALASAYERIYAAGRRGLDAAAAEVLDAGNRWHAYVDLVIGLDTSAVPEAVSVADMTEGVQIGEDFPLAEGYGTLVAAYGAALDVERATPATAIDWSGRGVAVETPRGTIGAGAAIVTASTSVLAQGGIRFSPDLPDAHRTALEACPLGCCEKVAILLDGPLDGFAAGETLAVDDPDAVPRRPVSLYVNPFGRPLVMVHVAGSYAAALAGEGEAAMVALGLKALAAAAGSAVRKRVRGAVATGWSADPFVRGAYSAARPGAGNARAMLRRPVGERIFLAGEAVSERAWASAHGAHESGIAAAERALAVCR